MMKATKLMLSAFILISFATSCTQDKEKTAQQTEIEEDIPNELAPALQQYVETYSKWDIAKGRKILFFTEGNADFHEHLYKPTHFLAKYIDDYPDICFVIVSYHFIAMVTEFNGERLFSIDSGEPNLLFDNKGKAFKYNLLAESQFPKAYLIEDGELVRTVAFEDEANTYDMLLDFVSAVQQ